MWLGIGIIKYLINIHKIWHKFAKKWNKCDVTIKSIITKITINFKKEKRKKKVVETIKKSPKKKQN